MRGAEQQEAGLVDELLCGGGAGTLARASVLGRGAARESRERGVVFFQLEEFCFVGWDGIEPA